MVWTLKVGLEGGLRAEPNVLESLGVALAMALGVGLQMGLGAGPRVGLTPRVA